MGNDYTALDAALNNLQAAAADIEAAIKAFETPPVELPGRVMYTTTNLNVRVAPVTGAIVATLLKGDSVRVIDIDPAPWTQIVTGPYTGRYVSGTYLSPNL